MGQSDPFSHEQKASKFGACPFNGPSNQIVSVWKVKMPNPVRYLTRVSMISMSLFRWHLAKYGPINKSLQLYKLDYSFFVDMYMYILDGANPSADIESTGNILDAMKYCTTSVLPILAAI